MSKPPLVLLDIGNTSVTYAFCLGSRILRYGSDVSINIPKIVKKWLESGARCNDAHILISSVVPKNMSFIIKSIGRHKGYKYWVAGQNLPVKVKHRYNRQQIGMDRLVNVYGALRLYEPPLLVIDFGTAMTLDCVSRRGVFEGGMIIPGPEISFQALLSRAALLPKKARLPENSRGFLGRNTIDCMRAGILQGYGAMTDGLVDRFRKKIGKNLKVIATGGFARTLSRYTSSFDVVDPRHTLRSLLLLAKDAGLLRS